MARQKDSCWRCGTRWVAEGQPALRLIPIDAETDRWTNEGESFVAEVTPPLPASASVR
jgi:hypothetical protein